VEYQADSWSEITDAAGRNLAYDLKTAGTKLRLNGEAPFRVFLGYAPGVTIYYNGTKFDHSAYHRADMARFRVGSAEDNQPGSR
jgi:cytoskeleton protein RodZ